jgi:hypothetical protein
MIGSILDRPGVSTELKSSKALFVSFGLLRSQTEGVGIRIKCEIGAR